MSGGRDNVFFVVLDSGKTITMGTGGEYAFYDSVLYNSNYTACQNLTDLYYELIQQRGVGEARSAGFRAVSSTAASVARAHARPNH